MDAPRLPSIFKSRNPRQFFYRPLYFNAVREERERRNKEILDEMQAEKQEETEAFRSKLRERWNLSRGTRQQQNRSNFRFIAILVILMIVTFYLLA